MPKTVKTKVQTQPTLFDVLKIQKPESKKQYGDNENDGKSFNFGWREEKREKDWWFIPNFLQDKTLFSQLFEQSKSLAQKYYATFSGKVYEAKRLSCKFSAIDESEKISQSTVAASRVFKYDSIPAYDWNKCPIVKDIKEQLEVRFNVKFDYCLMHVYRNGNDTIGWHADREGLNTPIASVSLGATRKFRFRPHNATSGWTYEYQLQDGDLVFMYPECQVNWMHGVPVEKTVLEPRINLTFRQFDLPAAVTVT